MLRGGVDRQTAPRTGSGDGEDCVASPGGGGNKEVDNWEGE